MWRRVVFLLFAAFCCPGGGFFVPPPKQSSCVYSYNYGMHSFDCGHLNLIAVPQHLNTDIQVLDLTFNRLRELTNTSFINYSYLKILYLEDNSISFIEYGAFDPLTDLEILDLSFNSLHSIPDALHSLPVLRKLSLAQNRLTNVFFMDSLPSVESLSLSECRLRELPNLEALPRLLSLNVSNNFIRTVDVHQLAPLCRLRDLDLRGNANLFTRGDGKCECTLLLEWTKLRGIRPLPSSDTICRNLPTPKNFDNATCFNNDTEIIFKESNFIARSCEAEVLEYGSGPIRIRKSIIWTIGIFAGCAIMLILIASVYCVRRTRRQQFQHQRDSDEDTLKGSS